MKTEIQKTLESYCAIYNKHKGKHEKTLTKAKVIDLALEEYFKKKNLILQRIKRIPRLKYAPDWKIYPVKGVQNNIINIHSPAEAKALEGVVNTLPKTNGQDEVS